MSKKDESNHVAGKVVMGAALAVAAGYVAGVLTAPKSGKETRKDIKDKAVETYAAAEKELKKLHTELGDALAEANIRLQSLKEKEGARLAELMGKSKQAKEKAREVLTGIHEGEFEDKDLQKAFKEATKAVDDLRNYLKK